MTKYGIQTLCVFYLFVIFCIPFCVAILPAIYLTGLLKVIFIIFSPFVFSITFAIVAGLLSLTGRKAIVAGRYPRSLQHPIYGVRRLYNVCWTVLYYSGPIYYLCLTLPWIKKIVFRLFGYKGAMDVTIYPDTWVRDLPLLQIESGVYLSNKATIGTNVCLLSGDILVDKITILSGAMIGHLCMIAPGVTLEQKTEVGVGSQIGIGVVFGRNSKIGANSTINHYAKISENVNIGTFCYIGTNSVIYPGIRIQPGTVIPDNVVIDLQEKANRYFKAVNVE